jgi:hypothetical protein
MISYIQNNKYYVSTTRDPDKKTFLYHACRKKIKSLVYCLIAHNSPVDTQFERNTTLLHQLCIFGGALFSDIYSDIARILLESGAEVTTRDTHNEIPLHYASRHGDYHKAYMFLQYSSPIHVKSSLNSNHYTALHYAHKREHTSVILLLIEYGSDISDNIYTTYPSSLLETIRSLDENNYSEKTINSLSFNKSEDNLKYILYGRILARHRTYIDYNYLAQCFDIKTHNIPIRIIIAHGDKPYMPMHFLKQLQHIRYKHTDPDYRYMCRPYRHKVSQLAILSRLHDIVIHDTYDKSKIPFSDITIHTTSS